MSHTKITHTTNDESRSDVQDSNKNVDEGGIIVNNDSSDNCVYAVTITKKSSASSEDGATCLGQKSFFSIHSTDHLCQMTGPDNSSNIEECNLEVLSRNDVFPSTSEESLTNEDDSSVRRKKHLKKPLTQKLQHDIPGKSSYMPTSSKSSTGSHQKDPIEGQSAVYSDYNIPKNTLYVVGSNPGEPKMSYQDPPKKVSKTMKKFLRNIDKHKNDQNSKNNEKAVSKLTTMRGILKDGRCGPECTGDSSVQGGDECEISDDVSLPFKMDFDTRTHYSKQNTDKNVTFNTHVLIIHFNGDLCVGQSVETLSKEKDQQARNSELRKIFLTKYNELWSTHK